MVARPWPAPAMSQRHSGDADVHYNPGWLQNHSVGQASLKLAILLPQPPKSWDSRRMSTRLACNPQNHLDQINIITEHFWIYTTVKRSSHPCLNSAGTRLSHRTFSVSPTEVFGYIKLFGYHTLCVEYTEPWGERAIYSFLSRLLFET